MSFLFKYYSLVKVMYLLISCCKTRFFLWNTNNTNRNGVNIQNKHTHTHKTNTHTRIHQTLRERKHWKGLVSMKLSDTPPFWKKNNNNSTYITNPSILMEKIWTEQLWKLLHWKIFSAQLFWNYMWRISLDTSKKLKGREKLSLQYLNLFIDIA